MSDCQIVYSMEFDI